MAIDIATGLSHLHSRNIIHGDLTPSNVLLKADVARPGGLLAKLADFGLSVKVPDNEDTVFNRRTGTPFYASRWPILQALSTLHQTKFHALCCSSKIKMLISMELESYS